jgi:hypothetical protein
MLRGLCRIDGEKTLGLELALQSSWKVLGVVICPTGGEAEAGWLYLEQEELPGP